MKSKTEVLFEDEGIVVINKPANFLTIPDRYKPDLPNLYHFLQDKYGEIFIVHRLDRETSGIIIFAKTAEVHRTLSLVFERRQIEKEYLAIVEGNFMKKEGKIDRPIAKSKSGSGKMVIHKRGKLSLSEYEVIEEFKHYSFIKVRIHTGRQHQVRVHMKAIGHPLAVDALYNNKSEFYLSQIKRNYKVNHDGQERPLMGRTSLHAANLKLKHPISGEPIEFSAEPPKDFKAVLNQLRKWAPV
ncbi:MAG: RluA family pseudouridine synthase [Bacteroidota bacterium]